jgi:hypothetical protein
VAPVGDREATALSQPSLAPRQGVGRYAGDAIGRGHDFLVDT